MSRRMLALERALGYGLMAVVALPLLWRDFPALPALYLLFTAISVLLGRCFWLEVAGAPVWERRGVPAEKRAGWARVMGALFLLNAALCPLGFLLGTLADFDRDFILRAQMIGVLLISLLGLVPLRWRETN